MKTIAFCNQKGGIGKTTSTLTTGACIAAMGKKTLLVDLDEQGSLTKTFNFNTEGEATTYEVLTKTDSIRDAIVAAKNTSKLENPTIEENLFILPADRALSTIELELALAVDSQYRLDDILDEVKDEYDFCLIDCPPKLGLLATMALVASDYVVIPVQADIYAMEGLTDLADTVKAVTKRANPDLKVAGILFTLFDPRLNLSKTMLNVGGRVGDVKLNCGIFDTKIHTAVAVKEAHANKQPVIIYDKKAKPSIDYMQFTAELLKEVENNG